MKYLLFILLVIAVAACNDSKKLKSEIEEQKHIIDSLIAIPKAKVWYEYDTIKAFEWTTSFSGPGIADSIRILNDSAVVIKRKMSDSPFWFYSNN